MPTGQSRFLFNHEGDKVELQCQTNRTSFVGWHFRRTPSGTTDEILSEGIISERYRSEFKLMQNRTAGLYYLVIQEAKTSHSGEYICYDDDSMSSEHISISLNVTSKSLVLKLTFNSVLMSKKYFDV